MKNIVCSSGRSGDKGKGVLIAWLGGGKLTQIKVFCQQNTGITQQRETEISLMETRTVQAGGQNRWLEGKRKTLRSFY